MKTTHRLGSMTTPPARAPLVAARALLVTACALLVSACGGDDAGDDGGGDPPDAMVPGEIDAAPGEIDAAPTAPLTLTSTAYQNGERIPDKHACGPQNVSPALSWTDGPTGTMSYAIVFTDLDNALIHSIIYDIPASVTSLAEDIDKLAEPSEPAGSKQPLAYDNFTRGYLGPCPGSVHTYEFVVYALDVATLPGVTLDSSRVQLEPVIQQHDLETASLQGTWGP